MAIFEWSEAKNRLLKSQRSVCFEDVVVAIADGKLLDIVKNPSANHADQLCLIVEIAAYAYIVPFTQNEERIFLKTAYPSRKQTKKYYKEQQLLSQKSKARTNWRLSKRWKMASMRRWKMQSFAPSNPRWKTPRTPQSNSFQNARRSAFVCWKTILRGLKQWHFTRACRTRPIYRL